MLSITKEILVAMVQKGKFEILGGGKNQRVTYTPLHVAWKGQRDANRRKLPIGKNPRLLIVLGEIEEEIRPEK